MLLTHTNNCGEIYSAQPWGSPQHKGGVSTHTPRRGILDVPAIKKWDFSPMGTVAPSESLVLGGDGASLCRG